jgi:hypothetical protein
LVVGVEDAEVALIGELIQADQHGFARLPAACVVGYQVFGDAV